MKRTIVLLMGAAVLLAGCGGASNSPPMQPPATALQFTALVKQVMVSSADTAAPVELTDLSIAYDDESPQAFDAILAAAM